LSELERARTIKIRMRTDAEESNDESAGRAQRPETREIIVAHDPSAGPVTAVRNVVLQASLSELRAHGCYERYAQLVAPELLEQLNTNIAPAWIPVDVALAHYAACDSLGLSADELDALGQGVGDRVQETVLVSSAKKERAEGVDLWKFEAQLHRMWPRVFQGGSVQVVKLGPRLKLIEERGFRLTQYQYFRQAHLAAIRASHSALGASIALLKVDSYNAARDEVVVRVAWH
jgi:hypothetical protein